MTTPGPLHSLLRTEAEDRARLLELRSYDLVLDLTGADQPEVRTYGSRTTIRLQSSGGATFLDVRPTSLDRVALDGQPLDPADLDRGRLPLTLSAGEHELVVDARMPFRNDGEGLHRSVDPADDRVYLYAMSFMDAAPTMFACFDQPDLKAPYTVQVTAPADWVVRGNGAATRLDEGRWQLATTAPLSTYFVTLVAGPYHLVQDEHDGIALGLSARASLAGVLDREAEELFTLTRQSFDELHRLFGIRYVFGDYHQAFVPEFNAGAMENPGCVTFRDQMLFPDRVTRAARANRASTVAHEMAHQWFGNLVTPRWWDDLWLNESFAEYLGWRVTADATAYGDAWAWRSQARRQWGLSADQRPSTHPVAGNGAADAVAALQDFDGISYAKGSTVLKQLATRLGDEVFLGGVVDHLERHRFANATMADLVAAWERAGAGDLSDFTGRWLRTAGLDTLTVDRETGGLRRQGPAVSGNPGDATVREHALSVAVAGPEGWTTTALEVRDDLTPLPLPGEVEAARATVVLDAGEDTWAASCADDVTVRGLADHLASVTDPALRIAAWNNVRSAFHAARLEPAGVVDLLVAAPFLEDLGDTSSRAQPWSVGAVLPAAPPGSRERLHDALQAALGSTDPDGDDRLRVVRGLVHTTEDPDRLRDWLVPGRLPDGIRLDTDLRWRLLVRLAELGRAEGAELDEALAEEPSTTARIEHARAMAARPDDEAKQWAWRRFTGEVDVANHELEATGQGLWRLGQEELTMPWVARFAEDLPRTVAVRSGWVLALTAASYFPWTQADDQTVATMRELAEHPDLPGAVRRRVADCTDDLARALAVRHAFPGAAS